MRLGSGWQVYPQIMELAGRRAVVTGASSGIGRAVTRAYVGAGAIVWGVGRSRRQLEETARGLDSASFHPIVADLTRPADRAAVASAVGTGSLDVAVHAAGLLGPPGVPLEEYPTGAWYEVFETNVSAVHFLHAELAPALHRSPLPTVIGVSSSVGRRGRAGWGMYGVSKFALEGWLQTLADEWADTGRVYSVNPGATATPMRAMAMPDEDPASLPSPDDIVPVFLHLARSDCHEPTGSQFEARDWIRGAVPGPARPDR